jgi:hypothetical protein
MTYGFEIEPVNRRVARSNLAREPIFSQFFKYLERPPFLESLDTAMLVLFMTLLRIVNSTAKRDVDLVA